VTGAPSGTATDVATRGRGFVVRLDLDGRLLEVLADPLERWEAGLGSGCDDLVDPGSSDKAARFLATVRDEGHAFAWELILGAGLDATTLRCSGVRENGHLLVLAAPLDEDLDSVLAGLTGINNEVVNRLRELEADQARGSSTFADATSLDRELVDLHRTLARRTADLELANEQKNRLIAMAAHDLRNPIGAIRGFAQLLLARTTDRLDERERKVLERIEHSSDHVLDLVNDLLQVVEVDREQVAITLDRGACDLVELVSSSVEVDGAIAEAKDIGIDLELACDPCPASVDARRIEQVLTNLITNAIKFSPRGSKILVRLDRYHDGVVLEVTDQGQGIPEDERDLIFQPFARTSVRPTEDERSTGLGLTIVRRVVEAHGGRVEVESEVGVGSTFRVLLPTEDGAGGLPVDVA
jgi:signal transduction histidine kinase